MEQMPENVRRYVYGKMTNMKNDVYNVNNICYTVFIM